MKSIATPCSISLGPGHKKQLQQVQEGIRTAVDHYPNRSQAIQVALLGFKGGPKFIKKLVDQNRRENDQRSRK